MTHETPISIRAYAKLLNVDEKAVRKAIDEGKIKKGFSKKIKKILPSKADVEWGNLHKVIKPQRGVSKAKVVEKLEKQASKKPDETSIEIQKTQPTKPKPDQNSEETDFSYEDLIAAIKLHPNTTYSEALRKNEILKIAEARMNLEEQRGMLVRKSDVEKSLFALGDMLKKSMFNIIPRCIDDIISAPNKVEAGNILSVEITAVFNSFAKHLTN